jgi:hypothetical protein
MWWKIEFKTGAALSKWQWDVAVRGKVDAFPWAVKCSTREV